MLRNPKQPRAGQFLVHQALHDPARFFLYETYDSAEALAYVEELERDDGVAGRKRVPTGSARDIIKAANNEGFDLVGRVRELLLPRQFLR